MCLLTFTFVGVGREYYCGSLCSRKLFAEESLKTVHKCELNDIYMGATLSTLQSIGDEPTNHRMTVFLRERAREAIFLLEIV